MQQDKAVMNEINKDQGICIIIPTYNNSKTLKGVIEDVLQYSENVIVVNDGSTDNTSEVLAKYKNIRVISYAENSLLSCKL